jgi:hypothetical protein
MSSASPTISPTIWGGGAGRARRGGPARPARASKRAQPRRPCPSHCPRPHAARRPPVPSPPHLHLLVLLLETRQLRRHLLGVELLLHRAHRLGRLADGRRHRRCRGGGLRAATGSGAVRRVGGATAARGASCACWPAGELRRRRRHAVACGAGPRVSRCPRVPPRRPAARTVRFVPTPLSCAALPRSVAIWLRSRTRLLASTRVAAWLLALAAALMSLISFCSSRCSASTSRSISGGYREMKGRRRARVRFRGAGQQRRARAETQRRVPAAPRRGGVHARRAARGRRGRSPRTPLVMLRCDSRTVSVKGRGTRGRRGSGRRQADHGAACVRAPHAGAPATPSGPSCSPSRGPRRARTLDGGLLLEQVHG